MLIRGLVGNQFGIIHYFSSERIGGFSQIISFSMKNPILPICPT
jgi:hypothetical protein